ncbi:MAG TPA: hypothetical protein VFG43_04520, partial [Geminicoccaceae bacterium]|nr:hypothetical protein [Geminicoccaceae bacterium]
MSDRRLRICYVVPGHNLLGTVGPSRNVLSLARALGAWADVTVAFRRVLEPEAAHGLKALEIEPGCAAPGARAEAMAGAVDDAAVRGVGLGEFA